MSGRSERSPSRVNPLVADFPTTSRQKWSARSSARASARFLSADRVIALHIRETSVFEAPERTRAGRPRECWAPAPLVVIQCGALMSCRREWIHAVTITRLYDARPLVLPPVHMHRRPCAPTPSSLLSALSSALLPSAEMLVVERKRGPARAAGSGGMEQPDRPSERWRETSPSSWLQQSAFAGSECSDSSHEQCPVRAVWWSGRVCCL